MMRIKLLEVGVCLKFIGRLGLKFEFLLHLGYLYEKNRESCLGLFI